MTEYTTEELLQEIKNIQTDMTDLIEDLNFWLDQLETNINWGKK